MEFNLADHGYWVAVVCFIVGFIVVMVRRATAPPPKPVPGTFRVFGVDRAKGADAWQDVAADSPENARAKSELGGMIVTRVERLR